MWEDYLDKLPDGLGTASDLHPQANQQGKPKCGLNGNDRGERQCALPRPCRVSMIRVSGHSRARSTS